MAALTSIDDDEAVARARAPARWAIVGLFHPVPHPYYDHLLRAGLRVADAATELAPQKRWVEAAATIDDELLDRLTFTGTPAQCAARVAEYDGLADEIIVLPLASASARRARQPATRWPRCSRSPVAPDHAGRASAQPAATPSNGTSRTYSVATTR